jgi:hypothetical protein
MPKTRTPILPPAMPSDELDESLIPLIPADPNSFPTDTHDPSVSEYEDAEKYKEFRKKHYMEEPKHISTIPLGRLNKIKKEELKQKTFEEENDADDLLKKCNYYFELAK